MLLNQTTCPPHATFSHQSLAKLHFEFCLLGHKLHPVNQMVTPIKTFQQTTPVCVEGHRLMTPTESHQLQTADTVLSWPNKTIRLILSYFPFASCKAVQQMVVESLNKEFTSHCCLKSSHINILQSKL